MLSSTSWWLMSSALLGTAQNLWGTRVFSTKWWMFISTSHFQQRDLIFQKVKFAVGSGVSAVFVGAWYTSQNLGFIEYILWKIKVEG